VIHRLGIRVYEYPSDSIRWNKKKVDGKQAETISESTLDSFFDKENYYWHTIEEIRSKTGFNAKKIVDYLDMKDKQGKLITQLDSDSKVKFKVS
jgi:hypothetical protein